MGVERSILRAVRAEGKLRVMEFGVEALDVAGREQIGRDSERGQPRGPVAQLYGGLLVADCQPAARFEVDR